MLWFLLPFLASQIMFDQKSMIIFFMVCITSLWAFLLLSFLSSKFNRPTVEVTHAKKHSISRSEICLQLISMGYLLSTSVTPEMLAPSRRWPSVSFCLVSSLKCVRMVWKNVRNKTKAISQVLAPRNGFTGWGKDGMTGGVQAGTTLRTCVPNQHYNHSAEMGRLSERGMGLI